MKKSILKEGRRYTFSDYFDLNYPTDEIVMELGYTFTLEKLLLPEAQQIDQSAIDQLRRSYYELLPKVTINSETAKREFMIAPLLYAVIREIDARLNIEYPIDVNEKLSGSLDYLLRAQQEIVVVEAKKGDLDKGFTQLAVELIALDQYESGGADILYGAITIGEVWRFGQLVRTTRLITKDIPTYRFPEDTEQIFSILTGILAEKPIRKESNVQFTKSDPVR